MKVLFFLAIEEAITSQAFRNTQDENTARRLGMYGRPTTTTTTTTTQKTLPAECFFPEVKGNGPKFYLYNGNCKELISCGRKDRGFENIKDCQYRCETKRRLDYYQTPAPTTTQKPQPVTPIGEVCGGYGGQTSQCIEGSECKKNYELPHAPMRCVANQCIFRLENHDEGRYYWNGKHCSKHISCGENDYGFENIKDCQNSCSPNSGNYR